MIATEIRQYANLCTFDHNFTLAEVNAAFKHTFNLGCYDNDHDIKNFRDQAGGAVLQGACVSRNQEKPHLAAASTVG